MTAPERLFADLPPDRVVTDPDVLAAYARDDAAWAEAGKSIALVRPTSTAEVAAVVGACAAAGVPIVPRGAGTGLSGGANAVDGGVVLSLERMDAIVEIDAAERLAVVQAGVVNDELRARPPPSRASGTRPTRRARPGRRSAATSPPTRAGCAASSTASPATTCSAWRSSRPRRGGAGRAPHRQGRRRATTWPALMVGSEGTLGVITEVTVQLRPLARRRAHGRRLLRHPSRRRATPSPRSPRQASRPSALELIDRACLRAVDEWKNIGLPRTPPRCCSATVDDPATAGDAEAAAIHDCFGAAGAIEAARPPTRSRPRRCSTRAGWRTRRLERPGRRAHRGHLRARGAVPEMLARIEKIAAAHDVPIATIAHAGDGNLHPLHDHPEGRRRGRGRALRPPSRRSSTRRSSSAAR